MRFKLKIKAQVAVAFAVGLISALSFQNCVKSQIVGPIYKKNPIASVAEPAAADCMFDGKVITSGEIVTAYQAGQVPNGTQCASEVRQCQNGRMSGSYTYASCTVQAVQVSCAQRTLTVQTSQAGVTCTDTLAAYTGPQGEVYSKRQSREASLGAGCSIADASNKLTVYYGTVSGGSYGTCQNWCAVKATCTANGWINFGYTW